MSATFDEIRTATRTLPADLRVLLAEEILEGISEAERRQLTDVNPAWEAELTRRIQEFRDDPSIALDGEQVMRELEEEFSRK